MNDNDKGALAEAYLDWAALYDRKATLAQALTFVEDLADLPLDLVLAAAKAHRNDPDRGNWMVKASDIRHQVQQLAQRDGRPGANEAWAMLPIDETASAVITDEMAVAWGVASPLLPDRVAARLAFKDRYEVEVTRARQDGRPVHWFPSYGTEAAGRARAIEEAVTQRRLTHDAGQALLAVTGPEPVKTETLLLGVEKSAEAIPATSPNRARALAIARSLGSLFGVAR